MHCRLLGRTEEGRDPLAECGRRLARRQARPLHPVERVGQVGNPFPSFIDTHRDDKGLVAGNHLGALVGDRPLEPKVPFRTRCGVSRDDGDKEGAVAYLVADLLVPGVAAAQFTLVEPHLDARGAQRLANAPRCRRILRRVTEEYGVSRLLRHGADSLAMVRNGGEGTAAVRPPFPHTTVVSAAR